MWGGTIFAISGFGRLFGTNNYLLRSNHEDWLEWQKGTDFDLIEAAFCYKTNLYVLQRTNQKLQLLIFCGVVKNWTGFCEFGDVGHAGSAVLVEYNRSLYLCGGSSSFSASSAIHKLQLDENGEPENTRQQVSSMREARFRCKAVSFGTLVFVIGGAHRSIDRTITGTTDMRCLSSVEIFDTGDNAWSYGLPMNKARYDLSAARHGPNIFVVGGETNFEYTTSCEKMDIFSGQWTLIECLPIPRHKFGLTAVDQKLYVVGGFKKENKRCAMATEETRVDIYDIVSNSWSNGPELPGKMGSTKCFSWWA